MRTRIVAFVLVSMLGLTAFLSTTVPSNVGSSTKIHSTLVSDTVPISSTNLRFDSGINNYMTELIAFSKAYNAYLEKQAELQREEEQLHQQQIQQEAIQATQLNNSSSAGIPSAWWPTALCEEGGRNDPNYGYFGIKEWNGFDGYPNAGSAPLDVQLAWEAKYIGGPPDAPGQCHSY